MSNARNTGFLTNVIKVDASGNVSFVSGSTTLATISTSGQMSGSAPALSSSYALSASYATNAETLDGLDSTAFATTGAYSATSASLYSTSASLSSASGSFNSRISTVESKYATTGSNTFTAPQHVTDLTVATGFANTSASIYADGGLLVNKDAYFSSSMYIKGNLTIYGTQSIAYITSSQLNIATNVITVNTATPAVRFGGLSVYDSGSTGTGATGSLFWDSQNNGWVYQRESGSTYSGGMLISGPRRALGTNLGDEQGLTACMIPVAQGGDHITSSLIYHDSAITCFGTTAMSNLSVNNSGTVSSGFQAEIKSSTSYGLKVSYGASNYLQIGASDPEITSNGGSSFRIGTNDSVALDIRTANNQRLNIGATGIACFACQVCAAGQVSSEDVRIYRSAGTTTGYINFGSTGTNYFGFDGTKYVTNGAIASTNGLFSGCIGIGATTVGAQLHIEKSGTDVDIKFTDIGVGSYMIGLRDGCARFEIASGNCLGTNTGLSIDTSGRVGIGMAAGTYSLSAAGRGYFFATNQDAGYGMLTLDYGNGDNSNIYAIQMKEGGAVNAAIGYGSYGASSCGDIIMWANNGSGLVERMRMYPSGRVAFLVEESASNLTGFGVQGRTCGKLVVLGANCTYAYIQSHGSVPLYINELGNNVIIAPASSNVGIGCTDPQSKLHIASSTGCSIRLSYGVNSGYAAIDVDASNSLVFKSYIGSEYMKLTCAGKLLITSNAGCYSAAQNFPLTINVGSGNSGIQLTTAQGSYTYIVNDGNYFIIGSDAGATGQKVLISRNAPDSTMVIQSTGTTTFACNVCLGQKTIMSSTAHFYGNSTYLYQQFIGGNIFTAGGGGDYIHIKTNIDHSDRMVGFNVRGYMYSPQPVDTDVAFYTYAGTSYVYGVSVYNKAYTGWNYCLYYSGDSKVVFVVQGSSTYGGFILNGINSARYNNFGEMCVLGITQTNTWSAQY